MQDIELITYLLFFALSLVFTMITISRKSPIFSFLSMGGWFTLALMHLGIAYGSMFFWVAPIYLLFGFTFLLYTFVLVFSSWKADQEASKWSIEL